MSDWPQPPEASDEPDVPSAADRARPWSKEDLQRRADRLPSQHPSSAQYEHSRHGATLQDLKEVERPFSDEEPSERLDEEQLSKADHKLAAGADQELAAGEGRERRDALGASREAAAGAQERLDRVRVRDLATDREVPEHEHAVDAVCGRLEITDPEKRRAVSDVYRVTYEITAPFVAKVVDDMLVDLRTEVERNPNLTVSFLGRDGHSLAIVARRLDPTFYAAHAREVVLSRSVVEAAVQDLEANAGKTFPEIADFRAAAHKVDPETVDGARQRLTEYLQTSGIPVGDEGSEIALVDTSYKGTVQELMTVTYPKSSFQGRYVFFGASPHDTHADMKKGYALHLDAEHSQGGRPLSELPAEEQLALSHQDAIGVIEETLHGPWTSPRRIGATGQPEQRLQRYEPEQLGGLNPVKVAEPYKDPLVREAAKDVALLAVADYAGQLAMRRAGGSDVRPDLDAGFDRYVTQVRSWIRGDAKVDPGFATIMNSFVRRADKAHVSALAEAIDIARLPEDAAVQVWAAYDETGPSPEQKAAFVARFRDDHGKAEETR